mmetsp:Transcript_121207/g.220445  ORF Transcript_121207/g.220445 Transcript_121207/m.220445 type:complete len:295 (-) Transcript_121207:225-1109(-)
MCTTFLVGCWFLLALASLSDESLLVDQTVQTSRESGTCAAASALSFMQKKSWTSKHQYSELLERDSGWNPTKPEDLHAKYSEIFKTGNRNAASHLWAAYVLKHAAKLSHDQIKMLLSSFCAISGSPVKPMASSRYKTQLSSVKGGIVAGYTYHCCWPCICDATDLVKVDSKSVSDISGVNKTYQWLVIGNPCKNSPPLCKEEGASGCLPYEAPELSCEGTVLQGAPLSDNGHIIIGSYEDVSSTFKANDDYIDYETTASEDGTTLKSMCAEREEMGFQSGMGQIFRQVAELNPI